MAYLSGAVFLLVSFYITLDVIGRNFFHLSSGVTDEMGGYALALGGMWALAHTLRTGGHVRIDVLLPLLPASLQRLLNYLALAIMAVFACVVALYCWRLALESFTTSAKAMSFLQTPLFVPQTAMALGLTVLGLEALMIFVAGILESLYERRLVDPPIEEAAGEVAAPVPTEQPLL